MLKITTQSERPNKLLLISSFKLSTLIHYPNINSIFALITDIMDKIKRSSVMKYALSENISTVQRINLSKAPTGNYAVTFRNSKVLRNLYKK